MGDQEARRPGSELAILEVLRESRSTSLPGGRNIALRYYGDQLNWKDRTLPISLALAILAAATAGGWLFEALPASNPDVRYGVPTILLLGIVAGLCGVWPAPVTEGPRLPRAQRLLLSAGIVAVGAWICATAVAVMLPVVFAGRINPFEADMLVLIDRAVHRALAGANPYTVYQIPWDAPISYGPYLWGPFILPAVLNADPRLLTLIALLIVPGACIWAAAASARARRFASTALFIILAAALALHPAVVQFFFIGHTPVYWPLLLVFTWLLRTERWTGAAIACGSLIVARTTMISLAPVLLMFFWHRGLLTRNRLLALIAATAVPFLPFLMADPGMLWYAMVGVYQKVMKEFVWTSTNWAHSTMGLTGVLLRHGAQRYVEAGQAVAMAIVYGAAWRAFARGARPEPWLVLALLVFSMTTLWPVIYVYFDVLVLAAAGLACGAVAPARPAREAAFGLATLTIAATVLVAGAAAIDPGASPVVDLGTARGARQIESGLDRNEQGREGERTFASVAPEGVVVLRLPRASRSGAPIHLTVRGSAQGGAQRVGAWLNGQALGQQVLESEWGDVTFMGPGQAWFYGVNLLELRFTSTLAGTGNSGNASVRPAAIDLVKVGR